MKTLGELFHGLDVVLPDHSAGVAVTDISEDSRQVRPGSLFVARPGEKSDGRAFIPQALASGAAAVLTTELDASASTPVVRTKDVARIAGAAAERFFGSPSLAMPVVGVTGTNGKTTVAHLTRELLNSFGVPTGMLGTVCIDTGKQRRQASLTTPQAIDISRALAEMRESGRAAAVMEVSSHALALGRVDALRFAVGVFTNLTGDHLDFHKTMDSYAEAKSALFTALPGDGTAIFNADDPWSERIVRPRAGVAILRCSCEHDANVSVQIGASDASATTLTISGPWGRQEANVPLIGRHNAMNLAQALASAWMVAERLGKTPNPDTIAGALTSVSAPAGRLEPVCLLGGAAPPCTVLVDYAHTDDALTRALQAVRPLAPAPARTIVVFGCGGDRDPSKRPRMMRAAHEGADVVVVTSDNPRTEQPQAIIDEILAGASREAVSGIEVEADREKAINLAIDMARAGDVVLIAGKGHEDYQLLPDGRGGIERRDFDDRLVARKALTRRFGGGRRAGG